MAEILNSHPYAPSSLSIPHYVPNEKSTAELLFIAGGIMTILVGLSYAISRSWFFNTTSTTRFTWFGICGLMHCGFEGYWLWNRATLASQNDIFAQLWKEYAHGDSRYLANDELLLTLEIMTTVTSMIFGLLIDVCSYPLSPSSSSGVHCAWYLHTSFYEIPPNNTFFS
ncbi:Endoglucanase [Mucor velutinosus]|uniref:Endoglucanase n=1 Tax=Mucor velutinosus TaxID=708070 RepID=A0AAN7DKR6_9FUNG|nr:Endoglucanase [Mucor velutinosus]